MKLKIFYFKLGDGHLRHLNRRYVDWESPVWVNSLGMEEHFTLNDGFLRIKETGLYFIYAQVIINRYKSNKFKKDRKNSVY